MKITQEQLRVRQSWSLDEKIEWSLRRIRIWYDYWEGKIYVSYSGGIDSTVLLHLVRRRYPDVPAVCVNGLLFPETRRFVHQTSNVVVLPPDKPFHVTIREDGWPVVSKKVSRYIWDLRRPSSANDDTKRLRLTGITKDGRKLPMMKLSKKWRFLVNAPFPISHKCCLYIKERPLDRYAKESSRVGLDGIMACDSDARRMTYMATGCNSYHAGRPVSRPLSIWMPGDVWAYIKREKIGYSPVYDMGYTRTGCVYCPFGAHLEEQPNRFQRLQITHPRLRKYCMEKLGLRDVLIYIGIPWRWKEKEA